MCNSKTHEGREINMKEAFALSCNSTYIQIGMETGAENYWKWLKNWASTKLCFTIPEEKPGYIPGVQEDGIGEYIHRTRENSGYTFAGNMYDGHY